MTETVDQAKALVAAYETDVKVLSRKPTRELAAIHRSELAAVGREIVYGGPRSKDEYLNAILDLRFSQDAIREASDIVSADRLGLTVDELKDSRGCRSCGHRVNEHAGRLDCSAPWPRDPDTGAERFCNCTAFVRI